MTTRRKFFRQAGTLSAAAALSSWEFLSCTSRPSGPPNILWLIADDLSPDLGCYGESLVKTPHLDKLAQEGCRFTQSFATAPVCSPTRSAFMTGMYQTTIGAHQHRTSRKEPLPDQVRFLTDILCQAGYFACNANADMTKAGKTDYNFLVDNPYNGIDWRERAAGQPFFQQVQFFKPHRLFQRDPERPIDPDKIELPPCYPDHPLLRRDWADYLETIQLLDAQVGAILKRLEDDGLADNTLVMFFGDHGRAMYRAKQWLYEGGIHVPLIARWPGRIKPQSVDENLVSLIDLAPSCLRAADISPPDYMEGQDFLAPDSSRRQVIFAARDRCDETDDRIRCIRSQRFKYIRNFYHAEPYTKFNAYKLNQYPAAAVMELMMKQGQLNSVQRHFMLPTRAIEEFYDLYQDPHEVQNLAYDPAYQELLSEFSQDMDNWILTTRDQGRFIEEEDVLEDVRKMMSDYHRRNMERKSLPLDAGPEEHVKYWERTLLPD
jgi:N-sulfoglucosamine sulfohydrolase